MTYAPAPLKALGAYLVANGAVNLGVVGDTAHARKGVSYHLGADKLTPDAYSRRTARDRAGLTNAASAIDIGKVGGTLAGLRKLSLWLVSECQRGACPDIREVIYSPDGKIVQRWESSDNQIRSGPGQGDNSHLTHTHVSFYRDSEARAKVPYFRGYFEKEGSMSEQDRLGAAIKVISEKYLGNVLAAGDTAGILKWSTRLADYATRLAALVSPTLTRSESADLGEPEAAIDFSKPSNDTVGLLNQWLAARENPDAVSGSLFERDGDGDIVQLVANIVGHGSAYHSVGDVSSETLTLAQMLNEGNKFSLSPLFLASLASGEPEYARSLGVASKSIVA